VVKRLYRLHLKNIPSEPRGLEVKVYDNIVPILKWHGREVVIASDYEADLRGILVCFYVMEPENIDGDNVPVLKKREAQVINIERLHSSSLYYWRRD